MQTKQKGWIEIRLVDENNDPVPGERYWIELPNRKFAERTPDQNGCAKVRGFDPGTCKVMFSNLDKDAWEKT